MQNHKPYLNQEGKAPNLSGQTLRFLIKQAERTGRPLKAYLRLVGYSGDADRLSREVQQSKEEHLSSGTLASPELSVGRPNSSNDSHPLGLTVASARRSVRDVMEKYRSEAWRWRLRAEVLEAYGLDPKGRDATARLARLLFDLALDVAIHRYSGHARRVTVATLMLPTELLAAHLEVRRETIWRALKGLKGAGFVDARAWRTTSKGETRAAGTLFAVRLKPGPRARLTFDEFKHPWRDLDGDRARGRTAWAWIQKGARPSYDVLLAWALGDPLAPGEEPVPHLALYDIYALPGMLPHEAVGMVTALAEYLAREMNDDHSRAFYAKLLWKVVYLEIGAEALIIQIERVLAEAKEGWARKPGALLAFRLSGLGR